MDHRTTHTKARGTAYRGSSLGSLEPIDSAPFRRPSSGWFVWGTLLAAWLISLLPWRLWQPAPDLLLLLIAFWCLHEPRRVSMLTAFIFGLFMDVHDGGLLGEQALVYTIVAYGTIILTRRLLRFSSVVQALHMLPIVVLAESVSQFIRAWLAGEYAHLARVAEWSAGDFDQDGGEGG